MDRHTAYDPKQPLEIQRTIRSFDPCIACAVHLVNAAGEDDLRHWEELLFDTCTRCGRCTTACPMGIDIASIVGGARQAFVAAGLGPADLLADEHDVSIALDKAKADDLLTVSSIETVKYPESVVAMAKMLNHAGVDAFGVLRWAGANMLEHPLPFAVMHISEFMAQLKRDGRSKLVFGLRAAVTSRGEG